jgi:hypothetical protein
MPNEPDPMNLWQQQPTEGSGMALEKIHRKAQELQAKSRRESAVGLSFLIGLIALSVWKIWTGQIVQQVVFAVIGFWSFAALIVSLRQKDVVLSSHGVEFYRSLLKQRRDRIQRGWLGLFGPILLAAIAFALPAIEAVLRNPTLAKNAAPFFVLLSIWAALYVWQVVREIRRINRELEELP